NSLEANVITSLRVFESFRSSISASPIFKPCDLSSGARGIGVHNRIKMPSDLLGAVAGLVGIEGGVVSEVFNLESTGVEAPARRPRHDQPYYEP
ncbi:MAG: hypothetical protein P4M09_19025, partial [Devosia sp.]|nr:hypothetical protein [Devosia sp.]